MVEAEPEVDKTTLEAKVIEAQSLDAKDYTEESWEALAEALEDGEYILEDEEATQEEVDNTLTALEAALAALEEVEKPGADIFDKVKFTISSGDTTVSAAVNNQYQVRAVIPKDGRVNAGEATLGLEMTDIASLGIVGTRSHFLTINTGLDKEVKLDTFIKDVIALKNLTINGTIGENQVVYSLSRANSGGEHIWLLNPDTVENAEGMAIPSKWIRIKHL